MDKMNIYNEAKSVPKDATKPINGGKLQGFSNINPMYRIKRLTELFGPCGTGWWYEITNRQLQPLQTGEIFCFVDINLFYKTEDGEISQPIPGTGGSSFVSSTRNGLQASDECYKMALTDAISVSAKALGVGADVYWAEDHSTKYEQFADNVMPYVQPNTVPVQTVQVQPQMQYVQPSAQPVQQAFTGALPPQEAVSPQPQMQAQPPQMSVEQAKALIIETNSYQKGKTLGEVMTQPRGMESLDFIARRGLTAQERAAAQLLKDVMKQNMM